MKEDDGEDEHSSHHAAHRENTVSRLFKAVLWIQIWIRIRKDQHFYNLDLHPDQHPIKIQIRIKIYKLDPELDPGPHQFADVKPKCIQYEPILALFQGFEPFL